eukprot:scaffold7934_cov62-Phaeocystis_antarctica.AAC.8
MLDLGIKTVVDCPLGLWIPPAPLAWPLPTRNDVKNFTGCPYKCAAGHFGNTSQEKDARCSGKCNGGGEFCPDASVQPLLCPAGTYLPVGVAGLVKASCIPCAPGAYNPDEGGTRCSTCPAGKLSENINSTECSDCPRGGSCSAEGAASLRQTFTPCPAGTFNPDGGQNSSASCQACAPGKANPIRGSYDPADCRNCSAGFVAADSGAAFCDGCTAGKYQADEGKQACVACEPGSFCPEGASAALPCKEGSHSDATNLTTEVECTPTAEGHYAPTGSTRQTACSPGTVAPNASMGACLKCEAGTFQATPGQLVCGPCTPGSYCAEGAAAALPCKAGTYQNETMLQLNLSMTGPDNCLECPPGSACGTGAAEPSTCSPGTVAPNTSMATCVKCASGTYQEGEGEQACVACEPGSFCPEGASAALPCKEGSYSDATNLTSADQCTPTGKGHFAPTGSTEQTKCSPGTVQPIAGKGACDRCAAGTYQAGEGEERCVACEPGSYCPEGASAPLPCEKGSYSSAINLTSRSECTETEVGHFAPTGSTQQTPCNKGTVAPAIKMGACELCEPGSYQPDASSTACIPCAVASYCPNRGTTSPTPCPGGTYSTKSELAYEWQCTSVEADPITNTTFYAPTGSKFPEECPGSGFVCPGRTADKTNEWPGSKPIPVVSGKTTELKAVEVVEFDLELDTSSGQFDRQDFVEWLAQELGVSASLISAEVTPIDVRRTLAAKRRRLNGTSTLSSGGRGLKLEVEVTIQVPQELNARLRDVSLDSTLAERAEILRSLVNDTLAGTDLEAALGVEFTVSRSAEVVTVKIAIQVDCAPGYCTA